MFGIGFNVIKKPAPAKRVAVCINKTTRGTCVFKKIAVGVITDTESAIADAKKAVESGDAAAINAEYDKLTRLSHKIAESLYQAASQNPEAADAASAGAAGAAGDAGHAKPGGDDVIDAEYIDVDEKK